MSSKVNVETVKMTAGINLPNSVIVQGGVDGAFFPANQIGWGDSTFMNSKFGGTSEGLLSAIEHAITEDEQVIANALNNLNTRSLNTVTSYTAADASLSTRISVLENAGYTTMTDVENYVSTNIPVIDISSKQDVITDLDTIRAGAAKGATALQYVPDEYVTETELNNKGYLTEHQDISGKANIDDVPTKISELENDKGYLTQTDKTELSQYDQFLLNKITELQTKLTDALNRIATLESEMENTLCV